MSDSIIFDQIDMLYLNDIERKQFPIQVEVKSKHLKPIEEIIKDDE